jgi:hypothetical protein
VSGVPSAPLDEGTVVATSARAREDRSVNRPLLATTEIHGTATRVRVVAQGCIELGQYLLTSGRPRQRRVPPVVQELDQVSQDLLALASNLTRLATAIEEGRPPETNREGRFADPATPT